MIRTGWVAAVCLVVVVLGGCVAYQSGEVIDPGVVGRIQRNVTTRAQVEAMLGPPMNVNMVAVGYCILKYSYKQIYDKGPGVPFAGGGGSETRHQLLLVWIGPDNVVQDFEFTDYVTDRTMNGTAEVVKRAAVTTQPGEKPMWFPGGDD